MRGGLTARFVDGSLIVAVIALALGAGYLAQRFHVQFDFTQNARNSLSQASVKTLKQVRGPVVVTAFASTDPDPRVGELRPLIRQFLEPYQRVKRDLTIQWIDPKREPNRAQAAGIRVNGEMLIQYAGKTEHLARLSEAEFTNALIRLARQRDLIVMNVEGHGERELDGVANHDLGDFGRALRAKGFKTVPLNLSLAQAVPSNAAALIVTQPRVDWLPQEINKLRAFVASGGNLLWLVDPEPLHGLEALSDALGLALSPGVVVDPAAQQINASPFFAIASAYPNAAVTHDLNLVTLFPFAREIDMLSERDWKSAVLLRVAPRGWLETDLKQQPPRFDATLDKRGPITIGLSLERTINATPQRVIVVGSGGFLANAYLGNGGNLELGLDIVNWIVGEDAWIAVQPKATPDHALVLSQSAAGVISIGFLFGVPLLFLVIAFVMWRRRR